MLEEISRVMNCLAKCTEINFIPVYRNIWPGFKNVICSMRYTWDNKLTFIYLFFYFKEHKIEWKSTFRSIKHLSTFCLFYYYTKSYFNTYTNKLQKYILIKYSSTLQFNSKKLHFIYRCVALLWLKCFIIIYIC